MTKHILLYTDDPGVGGVAQYNHSIVLGLKQRGYRVTLVQSRTTNPLLEQQIQLGIEHEWLDFDTQKDFDRTFHNLTDPQDIFDRTRPDLILFSDGCPTSNFAAKQVALQLGIPYLVVIGFAAPYLAERFAFCLDAVADQHRQAKAVIAVSQENLEVLHQRFRLSSDRGEVIHYGRPELYFAPPKPEVRDRLRSELGIPEDGILCFTAARLEGIKGYQYQLDAIVQLKQTVIWPKLYFVWAGEGPLRDQIRAAIQDLKAANQIKLLGHRWDVADWYDAADIFVFPSEMEGMPLAVMEAMAKGLPVAASAVSGIPEELGNTGKLLPDPNTDPHGTIRELVATIQAWGIDPGLRAAIGQACQQRARTLFTEQRMVEETLMVVERALLPDGDYVSPGLAIAQPDAAFPNMVIGDPQTCPWIYLRRNIPHNWYVDRRQPIVGFLSRDEAHILYNTALQFKGKRALEIGCWLGWSACHLALAGVELDVVDPLLAKPEFYQSVSESLNLAGVLNSVNLVSGYSPQAVQDLSAQHQRKWSLIFIDGNHDTPGPLEDAIACEQLAEPDALIVFHDLASPEVTEGLDYLKQRGWNTLVYQTMQIMGVAWRGNVQPVHHQPDPRIAWELPEHLQHYTISGITDKSSPQRLAMEPQPTEAGSIIDRWLEAVQQLPPLTVRPLSPNLNQQQLVTLLEQGKTAYRVGDVEQAKTALTQTLSLNPGSAIAHHLLSALYWQQGNLTQSLQHHAWAQSGNFIADSMQGEEFQAWIAAIAPYTLLSQERLFSLYSLAKQICLDDIPGNFVECGAYKGGSTALLAAVVQRYSLRTRLVYSFDTFEGMPDPTDADRFQGIPANETPWGAGTLKAPLTENLQVICQTLRVSELVRPVPGLFAQTLPKTKDAIGDIAFLHADGDWYESTVDIFTNLYDRVVPEGFIQIDDYGHWEGCRKAIHEFERQQHESFALRVIDMTGVWFRKRDPAEPNCNYWRHLWHWAQLAEKMGDRTLAQTAAHAVLQIVPKLVAAEEMLERLTSDQSPQVTPDLPLRPINLIVFPDWQQSEEVIFTDFVELLRPLLPHWDRHQITLLFDITGTNAEQADMALSDAIMHLLTEDNLEVSEEGPTISAINALTPPEWQTLLPHLTARIVLAHENQEAIAQSGTGQIPALLPDELATTEWG
ncbi:MAG TPA: TylF/MycF/NovP-related O-methyltransferase [Crinalium sp.]|jgi:glycosyltransferase involved in cell wall biosynthesis/predicted O-methyltransferase YrrM